MEFVLPSDIKKYLPALERAAENAGLPADTERALKAVMDYLLPPWSAGLRDEFWVSEIGQLIARAQWSVNQSQHMTIADAARYVYGDAKVGYLINITNNVPLYRRPDATFKQHRKGAAYPTRSKYVLRSDVEAFKRRLEEQTAVTQE